MVSEIRKLGDFPIIACGGISNAQDIFSYKKAGADFFGIGSALFKMDFDEMKNYFKTLNQDLKERTNLAEKFLHKEIEDYLKFKVTGKKFLTQNLFLLKLDGKIKTFPGKFVFLWLPGVGEKPFSIFDDDPLTFLIRKVGPFTEKLSKIKKGNFLYLRGPYGKDLNLSGKILLCGGGTGIASLLLFAKNYKTSVFLSAKEEKLLLFAKKVFSKWSRRVYFKKGPITEVLAKVIRKEKLNFILNCGPKKMIEKVVEIERKFLPKGRIYSSFNFLTKCGVGLCGSCATKKGLRACVDGPFLKAKNFEDKN